MVDSRQALHLKMVFETARRAGWLTDEVSVAHVTHGTVLGLDGARHDNRVLLCRLTGATLELGLALLGIAAPARL